MVSTLIEAGGADMPPSLGLIGTRDVSIDGIDAISTTPPPALESGIGLCLAGGATVNARAWRQRPGPLS